MSEASCHPSAIRYCYPLTEAPPARSLHGPLPHTVHRCVALQELQADGNEIEGELPKGLGACAELLVLILSNNSLTGPVPPALLKLAKLELVNLSFNHLEVSRPARGRGAKGRKGRGGAAATAANHHPQPGARKRKRSHDDGDCPRRPTTNPGCLVARCRSPPSGRRPSPVRWSPARSC